MLLPQSPWSQKSEDVLIELQSGPDGLDMVSVQKRYDAFGPNALREEEHSKIAIFLNQFTSPIVLILIAAAIISMIMGHTKDTIIIGAILFMNAMLGFYQEFKAETSIRSLQKLTESHSHVLRNGIERLLPSRELVPGDIVIMGEGDIIPADIRLLKSFALQVDEAILTGESLACGKAADTVLDESALLYEQSNCVFSGTSVIRGKGIGVIFSTGESTVMARIAQAARKDSPHTPLTRAMRRLSRLLLGTVVTILFVLGIISLIQGRSIEETIMIILAQLVSAVPEGLPIVITVILAIGAYRLSRHKILVRHLPSVESLGSATLIAADKTGTITEGVLSVKEPFALQMSELRRCAALCNDARNHQGDSVDVALARWLGDDFEIIGSLFERVFDHPFDPVSRMMATVNRMDGLEILYVKGAYEALLSHSDNSPDELDMLSDVHDRMALQGLRVLAFGQSDSGWEDPYRWKIRITGLIGFADKAKEGVKEAIELAKMAGIRLIMITGDNPITASVIAKEVGIMKDNTPILMGKEIDTLDDNALLESLQHTSVVARAMPEHKYRIVQILQKSGEIVAVTGDGVNDVPALKAADLGIAMGSGSEAAKSTAKMVIVDNNLGVIINAIRQGRIIADNLRKVIFYLLSTSFAEIIIITCAIVMALPLPLHPTQILWINIVTDGVCDKTFAVCKEESDVMRRSVRHLDRQFFDPIMVYRILWFALATASMVLGLFLYLLSHNYSYEIAMTAAFTTLVAAQWINAILSQKESEPFFKNIRTSFTINPWIWVGVAAGIGLQTIALYILPEWFHVIPPTAEILGYVLIASLGILLMAEGYKWIEYRFYSVH
ncbi:cation-translocating P-type ATPase [Sulfuricurvum sp.]|uniref:cation-translocating P-type ATPase n=1 Tax=Sulfuricurvum sp. TaxID=2025608 RepID=UPI003C3433DC